MPLVEGLGDEVTIILALLTIIIVLLIAWFSTHTRDIPFFSVIVVELSQRAARNQQSRSRTPHNQQHTTQESDVSTPAVETLVPQNQHTENTKHSPVVNIAQTEAGDNIESVDNSENSSENQHSLPNGAQDEHNVESKEDLLSVTESAINNTVQDTNITQSSVDLESQSVTDTTAVTGSTSDESSGSTNQNDDKDSCLTSASIHEGESESHSSTQTATSDNIDVTQVRHRQVPSNESPSSPAPESVIHSATSPTPPVTTTHQDILDSANDDHLGQIRIRLKYLNDTQRLVYSSPSDTIGQFRRAHFSTELAANKLVRLIFNGQDMRNDTSTLQGYNITDNSVIHCLVTQNLQSTTRPHTDTGDGDTQLGSFMMPLFAFILAAVWYLRITQRQYFNAVSTLSLAGVTFLFLLGCASVWRTGGHREHQHVD